MSEAEKKGSPFVHLHAHTIFSFLDGVSSPQQYAERCYNLGYPAMAATEHGHMGSVPDMYIAFQQYGLKSIVGCEIYYNDYEPVRQKLQADGIKYRSPEWRKENQELAARMFRNRHLTIVCKNQTGVENLIKLTTQAYDTGLFGLGTTQYNRIWFEKLCEFKEGLIVLSGCLNGPVSHELRFRNIKDKEENVVWDRSAKECFSDAAAYVKKFKDVFGEDYFMELQMPGVENDEKVFRWQVELADHYKIPSVITNDCHYMHRKDFILQKIMMAISQETTVDSPDLFHVNSDEQYMKTREELFERFSENAYSKGIDDGFFQKACDNTLEIANRCSKLNVDSTPKIPSVDQSDKELIRIASKRLKELGLDKVKTRYPVDGKMVTYVEQAKIELARFIEKGFSSYFLITYDLIDHGRSLGFPFYPRGSAPGSLVCYLLGISSIDPLKWGLSFDRFLSPSRGGYLLNVKLPEFK